MMHLVINGVAFYEQRAYRSRHSVWHTADHGISIHNSINRDGSLTVFVDRKLLPRSYKTLNGAARAAIKQRSKINDRQT